MSAPTVLFAILPEGGHLNPTWKVARGLRARGFSVRYLLPEDLRATAEAQGFTVDGLFPDLFPRGYAAAEEALGTLDRRRSITSRYAAVLQRLERAPTLVRGQPLPDLLVVDVTQPQFAFWARKNAVPFVYLNTSLPQTRDPGIPPLRSATLPATDLTSRLRVDLEWRQFLARRTWSARAAQMGGMQPPYDLARAAAPAFGIRADELDCDTVYMPQLKGVKELVLCPRAIDFARSSDGDGRREYVESVDLSRGEPPFAFDRLREDKPLVYCAMGTTRYRAEDVTPFLQRLVRVFRARPEWQLVLAWNRYGRAEDFRDAPPNVLAVERAPQLGLLKRAQVMVTHGGLGSVKEALAHGVPMLGLPLAVDQPGNVARVVHHGVGLREDVVRSSEADLREALSRLLSQPLFSQRARAMRAEIERTEAGTRGVDALAAAATEAMEEKQRGLAAR